MLERFSPWRFPNLRLGRFSISRCHSYGLITESILLVTVSILIMVGVVMVFSASIEVASLRQSDPFYYFKRHVIFLGMGILAAYFTFSIPLAFWRAWAPWMVLVVLALLLIVLIPGVGHKVNGSRRWLNLIVIRLQISELAKVAFIVYIACFLSNRLRYDRLLKVWHLVPVLTCLSTAAVLILCEPDLGAVLVLGVVSLGMLFLAGLALKTFIVLGSLVTLAGATLIVFSSFRLKRVLAYLEPFKDPDHAGYQLIQSLIAFGRGGVFGTGLGESVQKNFYLPEAYTDFIYAIICEELGVIGALAIIALFCILSFTLLSIGRKAYSFGNYFGAYIAYGAALLIASQALVSIGVNTGSVPTKGLTMPFISYGGTSLIVLTALLGLVYQVQVLNRQQQGWPRLYVR